METPSLQIIAYCCEHCAYAAADLAGGLRMQYPPNVKIVLLPCTGKLDVLMVLQAFEDGADGVMVAGCLPGNCHYLEGNANARRRVERIQALLKEIGLEPERVQMFNLSSAMAGKFVEITKEMTEKIESFGINPLKESGS
ncbi:MAG: hydrogenase iron-sulfur subunit [Chloroflexi bacterium]|nr:hydrogenase iron-sulfur subunit [Chloroflexota bacterium]